MPAASDPPSSLYADRMKARRLAALRGRATAVAYPIYYRLPYRVRRWLVRRVAPTFTVGAVVLVRDEDRLLLLRQPRGRGWSLPAGLLERYEQPIDGAVRELAEETGIRLQPEQLCPAVPNAVVHPYGRWVDLVFLTQVPAATTTLRVDGVEVIEAAWHDVTALPLLTTATARLLGHYGIGPYADPPPQS